MFYFVFRSVRDSDYKNNKAEFLFFLTLLIVWMSWKGTAQELVYYIYLVLKENMPLKEENICIWFSKLLFLFPSPHLNNLL